MILFLFLMELRVVILEFSISCNFYTCILPSLGKKNLHELEKSKLTIVAFVHLRINAATKFINH